MLKLPDLCTLYARWVRFWFSRSPVYEWTRLMTWVFPHPKRCRAEVHGFKILLDLSDILQANFLVEGTWEPAFSHWVASISRSAKIIIDVGAHCGYFSLLARRFAPPSAIIYAFEPNPRMQAQFHENVTINRFANIELLPMMVGDTAGTLTLYIRDALEPGASSRHRIAHFDRAVTVPITTLDDFCDQRGIQQIDLIKMDIEGGEAAALAGLRRGLMEGRVQVLLMEIHPRQLSLDALQSIPDLLDEAGYSVFKLDDEGHVTPIETDASFAGLGKVVAIHPDRLAALHEVFEE